MGSILRLGRSSREKNGNHSSILAWRIPWTEEPGGLHYGVAKSQARTHALMVREVSKTWEIPRLVLRKARSVALTEADGLKR